MRIDTNKIRKWKKAKKVACIKAKPISDVFSDKSVINHFLLHTLEGDIPVQSSKVLCVGPTGDVWAQSADRITEKYDVIVIDSDGWMICKPKENAKSIECYEVTPRICNPKDNMVYDSSFSIVATSGANIGLEKNVQKGIVGDFICRDKTRSDKGWIVKRSVFLDTYKIV